LLFFLYFEDLKKDLNIIHYVIYFMQDLLKQQDHNVIVLVEFAIALMTILDQINRDSFQRFKLRMGEYIENYYNRKLLL